MMIRAMNKINDIQGPIHFNQTNRRMFRELGSAMGGMKGFVIKHLNWWILRPFAKEVFENEPIFDALVRNTTILTHITNPPGPVNQIPEKITAYLDCRLLPGTSRKKLIRQIKTELFLEPGVQVTILDEGPSSKESDPESPFYKALERSVKFMFPKATVLPVLFNASTDNNYFRRLGIPTYGLVPAILTREQMEGIHNVDEKISLDNIETGVTVYSNFIGEVMKLKPDPNWLAAKNKVYSPEKDD
jgi:acetylornithine deacetylase/succinyl-diaminopimelate desuccinylase-like protein